MGIKCQGKNDFSHKTVSFCLFCFYLTVLSDLAIFQSRGKCEIKFLSNNLIGLILFQLHFLSLKNMASKSNAIYERLLAGRFSVFLSKYNENFYFHVKDTHSEKFGGAAKKISFTYDGLRALSMVLPEVIKIIEDNSHGTRFAHRAVKRPRQELTSSSKENGLLTSTLLTEAEEEEEVGRPGEEELVSRIKRPRYI
jgi:hypothetical protein